MKALLLSLRHLSRKNRSSPVSRNSILRLAVFPLLLCTAGTLLLLTFLADQTIRNATSKRHSSNLAEIPNLEIALILGCSEYLSNGRRNLYFAHRIDAALELFHSGRNVTFLVSGDNSRKEYNEPEAMKAALVRGGVPEEKIFCDYAGFRTLDSVVRAKKVFGAERFLVISQRFHNERAIFLAQSKGIEAYGYNAEDVKYRGGLKTRLREKLARVKTLLDISILGSQPKFLGEPISLSSNL